MTIGGAPNRSLLRAQAADYLPTLDGWRAVAIGLVLLHHLASSLLPVHGHAVDVLARVARDYFAVGVDIFFGISGFLICSRLLAERRVTGTISLKRFYIRRVFRIQPPALVVLGVTGVLMLAGAISVHWMSWFGALLLFQNYVGGVGYVNHFWSLSVEEHFYLTWPSVLSRLSDRRAGIVAVVGALAVVAWRYVAFHFKLFHGETFWGRTDIRLDGMLWGCVVAIAYKDEVFSAVIRRWLNAWASYALTALFVVLCAFTTLANYKLRLLAWSLRAFVTPVMLCATTLNPRTLFGRLLEARFMRWLGGISYSLYLWQQMFLVRESLRSPVFSRLQGWPLGPVCALACALVSYRFVEKPMIRWGHRLAAKVRKAEPRPTADELLRAPELQSSPVAR